VKRRILHVTTGLELGGAEALLIEAAAASRRFGDEVMVAALKSGGPNRQRLEAAGIPVKELDVSPYLPSPRAVLRLLRLIREFRPDIVHGWMYHANVFSTAALRLGNPSLEKRTIWGIYNSSMDLSQYSWRMRAVVRLGAAWSHRAAAIVYNAEQARSDHEAIGYNAVDTLVIRNGVDTARFRPDPAARNAIRAELGIPADAVLVLIAARNTPQKDWPTVLAGAAQARGVTTLAVGAGTDLLPAQPGLIRLGGRMDIAAVIAACDMFILPSAFGEGTSVAMSEAMACGLPVIVTDVGDNAAYARRAGFVVPTGDPSALARQIDILAADSALRERLGAEARRIACAEFDSASNYDKLHGLYDRLSAAAP